MKKYIVYNSIGEILRTGVCLDSDLHLQPQDGEFVMEGTCKDDANHKVVNGEVVYSPIVPTVEDVQRLIRKQRDGILTRTDWTQVPDASLTDAKKLEWRTYRQALRDLPAQYQNETDFANVVFPNPPE
jgi:hypothetical protein